MINGYEAGRRQLKNIERKTAGTNPCCFGVMSVRGEPLRAKDFREEFCFDVYNGKRIPPAIPDEIMREY